MRVTQQQSDAGRYAKCIEVSKRVRFDIDRDVIRGRRFDYSTKVLPDGLSKVNEHVLYVVINAVWIGRLLTGPPRPEKA